MGAQHGKPTPTGLLRPPAISYDRGTKSERSTELDEGLARSQRALPFTLEREATMTAEEVEEFMFRYRAGIEQLASYPSLKAPAYSSPNALAWKLASANASNTAWGTFWGGFGLQMDVTADEGARKLSCVLMMPIGRVGGHLAGAVHGICTSGKKQAAHPAKAGSAPTSIKPHQ
eukprot:CAMPEP_0179842542 /NCGR_PEP_ID=MMETSP0982-20121206/3185_1 /TAXON_ID=483367 /ORGANISM="non described non described, Strain CCMP 2436" /LENGTH=173 /DNA_ID=CAMNT_0021726827 /DNA_START=16 /DNA_END=539 /DNA_ORIENTATION=-